jgi:hypothetical protein
MSETPVPVGQPKLPEPSGRLSSVTIPDSIGGKSGGITVVSNSETEDQIRENFEGTKKPLDGPEPNPEKEDQERASRAGSDLGKRSAEARKNAAAVDEGKESAAEQKALDFKEAKEEAAEKARPDRDPIARMKEATRKEAEAKQQAREAKERAERAEAELARARAEKPADRPVAKPEGKPEPAQFQSYEEYLDARDEYNRKQWAEASAQYQAKQTHEAWLRDTAGKFKGSIDKAVKDDPDFFSKVAEEVKELRPSYLVPPNEAQDGHNWVADELTLNHESAPALMLHFTEHPDELQQLAALSSPRAVTRAMGKLVAQLEAATAGNSSKPEVSKAKPPVRPVTGSPHVADEELSDSMSDTEWIRKANAKDRSLRRSRR